jgi:hypothetical protein
MRRSLLLGAAALCLLGASACAGGGEDSEEDIRGDLSETFQRGDEGLDQETADCFADVVIDEVGVEALQDVDLSDDEPPSEVREEIAAAALRAADECE